MSEFVMHEVKDAPAADSEPLIESEEGKLYGPASQEITLRRVETKRVLKPWYEMIDEN